MPTKETKTYNCPICKESKDSPILPRGWKAVGEETLCDKCFRKKYVVRAMTLPVGCPVGKSWEDFRESLRASFRLATNAANWCVHQLFKIDDCTSLVTPKEVKEWYSYGAAKESYADFALWEGAKNSLCSILRSAHGKYLKERFDALVANKRSVVLFRYPYPFPYSAQTYSIGYEPGDFPSITMNFPGLGDTTLRLKRRADFGRQLAMFKALHDGHAIRGEAAIYMDRKGNVMVKIAGWFKKRERAIGNNVCLLHQDPAAFIIAQIDGMPPWILNCDHLKRINAQHKTYLQRLSEDTKYEKRLSGHQRSMINKSRDARCDKYHNRMGTAIHELSSQVARFCQRNGVAFVAYDKTDRGYFGEAGFPWHDFESKLRYKLDSLGIEWFDDQADLPTLGELNQWQPKAKATASAGKKAVANARRKTSHPAVSSYPPPQSKPESVRS